MSLYAELRRVYQEMAKMPGFDLSKETHPGGWKLWVADYYTEEMLIREELKKQMKDPNSVQVGGSHYRSLDSKYQHWDLVAEYGMSYFMGNMTKYLCRWRLKLGVEDLEKSMHYLEKLISLEQAGLYSRAEHRKFFAMTSAKKFCETHALTQQEKEILLLCLSYSSISDLMTIHSKLEALILLEAKAPK